MIRSLLIHVGLLLLPSALYLAWLLIVRRPVLAALKRRRLPEGPWSWLLMAGLGLMIASLVALALTSGEDPEGAYTPPRIEDGTIVPATVE